jgi:hypothetical protein
MAKIQSLTLDRFCDQYGQGFHRKMLVDEFRSWCLRLPNLLELPVVLVVYGSILTEKKKPNDLDVLLYGFERNGLEFDHRQELKNRLLRRTKLIHVRSHTIFGQKRRPIHPGELVEYFVEVRGNRQDNFRIYNWIAIANDE